MIFTYTFEYPMGSCTVQPQSDTVHALKPTFISPYVYLSNIHFHILSNSFETQITNKKKFALCKK